MSKKIFTTTKELTEQMMIEIWENAPFVDSIFMLLKKIALAVARAKDHKADFIPLPQSLYELSTVRNRNLISNNQQTILKGKRVGFFGLSVGSHAAITWILESRADHIVIFDPDTISPSNLNRLRFGWDTVGKSKVDVVKSEIEAIHPFATVHASIKCDLDTIEQWCSTTPLDAIVDAIDDMQGKILLRKIAKSQRIPLLSAADVGDNVVLDIERYDQHPQPESFLGRLPEIDSFDFTHLSEHEKRKLIIKLVGFENNSEAMLSSLSLLGKELRTWPQLAATATIAGGVITTSLKKIFLEENVKSGRYYISLDDILVSDFQSAKRKNARRDKITQIKQKFSL